MTPDLLPALFDSDVAELERITGGGPRVDWLLERQEAIARHFLAEGYRRGVEASEKVCDEAKMATGYGNKGRYAYEAAADAIRALLQPK